MKAPVIAHREFMIAMHSMLMDLGADAQGAQVAALVHRMGVKGLWVW